MSPNILWLNRSGEKQLEIRRYHEEIDDFRGWDSDEAGYRIAGNIKRLNRNGITNIQLERCHLVQVNLGGADLSYANLVHANLNHAILSYAILSPADLGYADLSGASLFHADLSGALLDGANLSGADLRYANLRDVRLLTNEQLAQAESLIGATLPDGTVLTEEGSEEFKERYRK